MLGMSPGWVWCWGCPRAGFGRHRGFCPQSSAVSAARADVTPTLSGSSWMSFQPTGGAQGHPRCSQPLGQWLRISTAKAYPLILLPAQQLPWRAPRSTSCHPLPRLRPSSQPSRSHSCWNFPIPDGNPDGFPSATSLGKLFQPSFPLAGTVHIRLCFSQSSHRHPHLPDPGSHLLPGRLVSPRCLFPGMGPWPRAQG